VTDGTETLPTSQIRSLQYQTSFQEKAMSFLQETHVFRSLQKADREHHGYGFILALLCVALVILVASAIFAPTPVGSGISNETWFVGP
jgi:hypothetical protein